MNELLEIVNGTLLGDGCIKFDNYKYRKYFSYKLTAKDKKFVEWFKILFKQFNINCWITEDNKIANIFGLYFYINSCPYPDFISLHQKWYKQINGKNIKTIPRDLTLTPKTLLFWYWGDGSLVRRKNDLNRIPFIVLATNTFSKDDVDFLIQELKELNLNFYPVKYKSGFTGKECGYCLYSNTQDGTPFRFFNLIGLECPKEIANFTLGSKGIYREEKFFKNKWPTEDEWIRILSNESELGKIIKERRKQIGLSRKQLTKQLNVNPDYIRKIEYGKRNASIKNFRKILKALNLNITYLLEELRGTKSVEK